MGNEIVIETAGLGRRFGRRVALAGVDLKVAAGGVHALVGRNGAGKSTLYRILLGFLAPTSGSSRVFGADSRELPPAVRGRIGFVYETHPLPGWMTVKGLVGVHRSLYPGWSDATFGEVTSLFRLADAQRVRELSRGERAGLALALALAPGPDLLMLDEPTLGLDVTATHAFLESLLFAGEREGCTILYSSHQMAEVERLADRVIVLADGEIAADCAPDELRTRVAAWTVEEWPATAEANNLPGLLQVRAIDGQLHLLVLDQGEGLGEVLSARGGRGIRRTAVGFERAMEGFLAPRSVASKPVTSSGGQS